MEAWKNVLDYEGLYEVSDLGRVRSLDRTVQFADGRLVFLRGRLLKPYKRPKTGYQTVGLWREGRQRPFLVHFLVLQAFIGPRPDGLVICHGDGQAANNRLSNLRYDSVSANALDAVAHGTSSILIVDSVGAANGRAVLTEVEVVAIKRRIKANEVLRQISVDYPQVSYSLIKRIGQGKVWGHIYV